MSDSNSLLIRELAKQVVLAARTRAVFQGLGQDLRLARLEVNVGNLYERLGRMADALACYDRAVGKLEESGDVEAAAIVAINRSVVLMLLYRFDEAMEGFHR